MPARLPAHPRRQPTLALGRRQPPRPKEALEHLRRPPYRADGSRAAFRRLAERISVRHCEDAAFNLLRDTLRTWFPENS